jgi:TfoX/Sxy family transcriptional regulator of competence genes
MAYSHALVERLSEFLPTHNYPAKRMFGGVVFFARGHMLVGVFSRGLMVRVSVADAAAHLQSGVAQPLAPKRMQGFIIIDEVHIDRDENLEQWIARAHAFNATLEAK